MGYTLSEIQGQHHRIFCKPDCAESAEYGEFWESLSGCESFFNDFKRIARTGESIWIAATYAPIFDADGRVSGVVKLAKDNTANKPADQICDALRALCEHDIRATGAACPFGFPCAAGPH